MINTDKHNKLFSSECTFIIGAVRIEDIPPTHHPEFAFIGRSNVGKSSLINALTKRNSLARTSQTPGCTRQINFFTLGDTLNLVDLPGYGYAKRDKQEKAGWSRLIHLYLRGRAHLKTAFLLMDARHPIKPDDIATMEYLDDHATPYQIVLTKSDKASAENIAINIEKLKLRIKKNPACYPEIIVSSANDKTGIDEIRDRMVNLL